MKFSSADLIEWSIALCIALVFVSCGVRAIVLAVQP